MSPISGKPGTENVNQPQKPVATEKPKKPQPAEVKTQQIGKKVGRGCPACGMG